MRPEYLCKSIRGSGLRGEERIPVRFGVTQSSGPELNFQERESMQINFKLIVNELVRYNPRVIAFLNTLLLQLFLTASDGKTQDVCIVECLTGVIAI